MSENIPDNIDLQADAKTEGSVEDLNNILRAVKRMQDLEGDIAQVENELEIKREALNKLVLSEIPQLMDSYGGKQLPLLDGSTLKIDSFLTASIPSESAIEKEKDEERKLELQSRREDALTYIRKENAESIIKNTVEVEFDKGQDNVVGEFIALADKLQLPHKREERVHAATLKNVVEEWLEKGKDVPLQTFSVYQGRKATIKKPKESKKR